MMQKVESDKEQTYINPLADSPTKSRLRRILTTNEFTQNALITAVKEAGFTPLTFEDAYTLLLYKVDEKTFQEILAPFLRAAAVSHLRTSTSPYVTNFKREYNEVFGSLETLESGDESTADSYIEKQARNYEYARDITAGALAEKLDMTFACTEVDPTTLIAKPNSKHIYYQSTSSSAPIIHLYNKPNSHFFIIERQFDSTIADGNCLYNGFAQIIRQHILDEEKKHVSVIQNQAILLYKTTGFKLLPIEQLIQNVRRDHQTIAAQQNLGAAIHIAEQAEAENPATTAQQEKHHNKAMLAKTRCLIDALQWHQFWLYFPSFFSSYACEKYLFINQLSHALNTTLENGESEANKVTSIQNILNLRFDEREKREQFRQTTNSTSYCFFRKSAAEVLITELGEDLDVPSLNTVQL